MEWEKRIHAKFSRLRTKGEWFKFAKEIRAFIEDHAIPWPSDHSYLLENAHMETERDGEPIFQYCVYAPPISDAESSWWMTKIDNRSTANPGTLVRWHGKIMRTHAGKMPLAPK